MDIKKVANSHFTGHFRAISKKVKLSVFAGTAVDADVTDTY